MLELYRTFRTTLYSVSSIQVFGFQIDSALHFVLGFLITLGLFRLFADVRKSAYVMLGLIAFKEIFDLFAKSRLEYMRPPALDALYDIVFGILGMLTALWLIKRRERRKSARRP